MLEKWISEYKKLLQGTITDSHYNEMYKWETVQHFQDNWTDDHDEHSILENLKKSFNKENNNLWSGSHFLPYAMLLEFAEALPARVSNLFKVLYDERKPLEERLEFFRKESEDLLAETRPDENIVHYQDKRSMLVYLALRYPGAYYLYKSSMYTDFCELTGFAAKPKRRAKTDFSDIKEYFALCDQVRTKLISDQELIKIHTSLLPSNITFHDDYHLLTQDFIYAVTSYLKPKEMRKYSIAEMKQMFSDYLNRVIPSSAKNYLQACRKLQR